MSPARFYCAQPGLLKSDHDTPRKRKKGHGRYSAADYLAATTVQCKDPLLSPGDDCPDENCAGHLYDTNLPQIFIRLQGRPLLDATRYEQVVLRCSACQQRFAAPLPNGVTPIKYDESADVAVAVMKYGSGMPMYRMEKLQSLLGIPLSSSTQFERIECVANAALPIFLELERQAARGEVIHADDTGIKILALIKENKLLPKGARVGMQTTGVGARLGKHNIALFYTGLIYTALN